MGGGAIEQTCHCRKGIAEGFMFILLVILLVTPYVGAVAEVGVGGALNC